LHQLLALSFILHGNTGSAKHHQLRHQSNLLLSYPVDLFLVSKFFLQIGQRLGHDDLIFLCEGGHKDLFHSVDYGLVDVAGFVEFHFGDHL
jgi:hypothetical protein